MEHRCDHRKLLTLEIIINDRRQGIIKGKTRNVSLSGMLVDISDTPLTLNTIIDVSFPVVYGGESRSCSAKAYVVHQQGASVGLMFSDVDSGVRQMLRKLIFGYATTAERVHHSREAPEFKVDRAVA
jgi:hypothetical protein